MAWGHAGSRHRCYSTGSAGSTQTSYSTLLLLKPYYSMTQGGLVLQVVDDNHTHTIQGDSTK